MKNENNSPNLQDGDDSDDQRFNETLIRMLKTPPKPQDKKNETAAEKKDSPGS